MLVSAKNAIGLPVVTKSGADVGRLVDINFKSDSHAILNYAVKNGFFNKQIYLIGPTQVVAITSREIVVDDAVLGETSKVKTNLVTQPQPGLSGVATRSE